MVGSSIIVESTLPLTVAAIGPVVRVGPNQLSFATIEAQNTIYTFQPPNKGKGEYFSKEGTLQELFVGMAFSAPNLGTIRDRAQHKRLRKRVQPAFSSNAIFEQESLHQVHLSEMLSNLDKLLDEGAMFNLTDHLSRMLWRLVGDLSFGEPLIEEKQGEMQSLDASDP